MAQGVLGGDNVANNEPSKPSVYIVSRKVQTDSFEQNPAIPYSRIVLYEGMLFVVAPTNLIKEEMQAWRLKFAEYLSRDAPNLATFRATYPANELDFCNVNECGVRLDVENICDHEAECDCFKSPKHPDTTCQSSTPHVYNAVIIYDRKGYRPINGHDKSEPKQILNRKVTSNQTSSDFDSFVTTMVPSDVLAYLQKVSVQR